MTSCATNRRVVQPRRTGAVVVVVVLDAAGVVDGGPVAVVDPGSPGAPVEWPLQDASTSTAATRHGTARTARDGTERAVPCGGAPRFAMMHGTLGRAHERVGSR